MLYIGISLIILGIIFIHCACVIAKKADEEIIKNTKRSEKKLLKIINHYGVLPQLKYFQSEVFELNEAIIKHENKNPIILATDSLNKTFCTLNNKEYKVSSIKHIAEEIADVMVMLNQFMLYYKITSEEITEIFWSKVDRQIGRIEKENIKKVEQ